jgi:hypothetical protein
MTTLFTPLERSEPHQSIDLSLQRSAAQIE